MSQVSKKKLDKYLEAELYNQFWYYLGKINTSYKSSQFYSDFFTKTEKTIFAKRFMAMILLSRGKTVDAIHETLHISRSTIFSISYLMKSSNPETQSIFKNISNEKNLEAIFDKIDEILDKLPLKPYTNWSRENFERRSKNFDRQDRKILR